MRNIRRIEMILALGAGVLLVFFLSWHYRLGLVRYFDVDEYAHLHWTSHLLMGKKPYVDFLTFFTPGYWWFLSLAFVKGWGTTAPFITARVLMFGVFTAITAVSMLIFWQLRKSWAAVLAAVMLAFLPLPFDKYLEIRPDSLATLFVLIAMFFQIRWHLKYPTLETRNSKLVSMLSGLFYALSFITLTKMVPNAAIGWGIAVLHAISTVKNKFRLTEYWGKLQFFSIGFFVPLALLGIWLLSLGDFSTVWYSLTKLPLESNKISQFFIMMPDLFFYPNEIFYGIGGWSLPLYVNHTVWFIALVFGVFRLLAPFIPNGKKQALPELLISLQFIVQVVFFVGFAPLKHAQYLIPIGVFIAWYAADFLDAVWSALKKQPLSAGVGAGLMILLFVFLFDTFKQAHAIKYRWTNEVFLNGIAEIYRTVPMNEPVLDLDGRMLYNPDAYYACCIPFGQFLGFLSRPLPDLPKTLIDTKTKYVVQGELERVKTLPWQWQEPIYARYQPMDGKKWILKY